jgi:DNA polymerase (family 10)
MDPRTAAHVLGQIAAHLELRGESRFKSRAYEQAAAALVSLDTDDLGPLVRSGDLASARGLGPATLSVVRDLVETGESSYLEQLRATTPSGLLELLRVPGLGTAKIRTLHEALGIDSVESLEVAARDGRLAKLPRYGPKTAQKILRGIELLRTTGSLRRYPEAAAEGARLLEMVRAHPDVVTAELAGSLRRRRETIGDVDVVAACRRPADVAASFGNAAGVREARVLAAGSIAITYVDGTRLDLHCVKPADFALAHWRATGSAGHVDAVAVRLAERGFTLEGDRLIDERHGLVPLSDEATIYAHAGLAFVPPEMREGRGEVEAAARGPLPDLIEPRDIRGVLHCHSDWSDGKSTIAEMAAAARERGWSYIGITDHSQTAFYAGGLTRERVLAQHEEIDALNASGSAPVRVLKGVECDILADGALDYDDELLDRFDFVIGSVHSRFSMDRETMTARVLRALDDPRLTILGHPTGRLLLSREPYAIDIDAVIAKAGETGAAVELNADPHRLDLDWRHIPDARAHGVPIEIGPDAHSTRGLDHMATGVNIARKGGLAARDVLNARSADDVLAFARARRERGSR